MKRILVIDDDVQFRKMLCQTLERAGYEVTEASDGDEGTKLYRQQPVDLVITDIIMPGKEGLETIMELKHDFADIKIIAISGGGRIEPEGYLGSAEKLGAAHTFSKPLDTKQLLETIHELLDCAEFVLSN